MGLGDLKREAVYSETKCNLNSWIATLVLLFYFVNGAIGIEGSSIITLGIIVVLSMCSAYNRTYKIKSSFIIIILCISICFIISLAVNDFNIHTYRYMIYFIAFNVIALSSGLQDINIGKTIDYSILVGFGGTVIYTLRGMEYENTGMKMGVAYAMLSVLFVSVIGLMIQTRLKMLAIINTVWIVILEISSAPRGVWLSIGFFCAICMFYFFTKDSSITKGLLLKIMIISIGVGVLIVLFGNLSAILNWINDQLIDVFNIHVYALWKYAFYLDKGNLLNGRNEIWGSAVSIIREGGMFGKGIGYLESVMDGTYAHNIILQMMCETGIVFIAPFIIVLFLSIVILITTTNRIERAEYLFFLLVFVYGVVMLIYSSVYWMWVPFWYFVGYFIQHTKIINLNKR